MPKIERLGKVFPKGRLTLVGGLPGSGKTHSTIKLLNDDDIEPIYFNLDHTALEEDLKAHQFDEDVMYDFLYNIDSLEDIENQVIIIDTYIRFVEILKSVIVTKNEEEGTKIKINDEYIVKIFEDICSKYNITLIIIGHTQEYVGANNIFKDNETLVRNCFEYIYIDKIKNTETDRKTKEKKTTITRILNVNKARAFKGNVVITLSKDIFEEEFDFL